uniref:hypothetical protein n=1 Tax=Xanthomonas albilineans TaxID=29447 RepID=UPI0027DD0705|nr:hypothetical protein [Xanthomonas albilineans]
MHAPQSLEQHLQAWANAYGGEQFARLGYAADDRLACTSNVSGDAAADRVEGIVQRLENIGRWKEARVLRVETFMQALPEAERLARLRLIGISIGRTAYYVYLNAACAAVELSLGEKS